MIVTGHSLGGALAVFAAMDIRKQGISASNTMLYPSGQPRTGNYQWAQQIMKAFPDSYYRIVQGHDPVPHLPPDRITFIPTGYIHGGHEVHYPGNNPSYLVCPWTTSNPEDNRCSKG